ncbi:hypothetical protein JAO76_03110 [Pontibacter sp. BT310]|uniref:M56 family metallopeptidase n=1 Tax=Pontibacter populi TaxID=890055 RepID=A0ABS6X7P9_9BACT|nr:MULTISPECIES: M56 family metallopeptidase [Pontibacter]MBJ6117165.1 hypothetical protein [Pontibacter sp. BT310]MBR0569590.1 hypothetical protein [Microvirga sp. STS03]MBW3364018.1 M56 family metallopeptidase [Pontibacter populi]
MPELLLYLLKVNVALVLFYLAYHVALRRLTFYHLNRLFLVFGIVFSTMHPLIDLSELFAGNQPIANAYLVTIPAWALTGQTITQTPTFDYWQLPVYLFWVGVIVMLMRFIVQFISLYKIHKVSEPANYKSIGFRQVTTISQAFSFWQTIYINPEQHKRDELEQILHHELIHITGWHTIDVLLAELSTVFYWFNPGAWLMKKAVKENLEFIADQQVVDAGIDKKEYQYLLLKVVGATQPQIANQFNFPSLKRRIAMMNKMPTPKVSRLRLLIALPLVAVLLVAFRSAASEIEAITNNTETEILQQNNDKILPKELAEHLKKNVAIKNVRGRVIDGKKAVIISLKGGGTEVYYLAEEASIAELERKYGLPELPPPPPPAPNAPDAPPAPPVAEDEVPYIFTIEDVSYYKNNLPADYKAFLKRNPQVKQLGWKFSDKIDFNLESIVIYLKNGKVETYDFNQNPHIPAVEAKYGQLPKLPAPPPPVPANEQLPAPPPPVKQENKLEVDLSDGVTYYIDGLEDKLGNYKKLDPDQIHSINVYKKESAEKVFGKSAAKGVVSIITTKNKDSRQVQEFQQKYPALPPPPVKAKSTIDKRETSATRPVKRNSYAQIDTLNGTAAQIRKVLYERQKAGEPPVDNLILFTKNSKGEGIDVFAELNGTKIESVKVLAIAN